MQAPTLHKLGPVDDGGDDIAERSAPASVALAERVRIERPSPALTLRFVERPHLLVGHGPAAWLAMSRLLGPRDGSRRHVAFTRWRVRWSHHISAVDGDVMLAGVRVRLDVTQRVPVWSPHPTASPTMRERWTHWSQSVREHEDQHLCHGVEAAHAIVDGLLNLGPRATEAILLDAVEALTSTIILAARTRDAQHDGKLS